MRHRLGRMVGWVNGDPPAQPETVPPEGRHAADNFTVPPRANDGPRRSEVLSAEEVRVRIELVSTQLRQLGAFEDTCSVPLSHLDDEQLERRIRQVEHELRKLNAGADGDEAVSGAESEAVTRQLEVLDYLIEHPDATIAPASALDALEDEPRRWARALLGHEEDVRED